MGNGNNIFRATQGPILFLLSTLNEQLRSIRLWSELPPFGDNCEIARSRGISSPPANLDALRAALGRETRAGNDAPPRGPTAGSRRARLADVTDHRHEVAGRAGEHEQVPDPVRMARNSAGCRR